MGSIIGALIGRHLAHTEEQRQHAQKLIFDPVASYLKDPANSSFTPDQVDDALESGFKMHLFPKQFKDVIMPHIDRAKAQWQAKQNFDAMKKATASGDQSGQAGGKSLGVPAMTPPPEASMMGSAPAAPDQNSSFNPLSMMGMAAQPAPAAAPMMGTQATPPPGLPPIPFASGADTGPAPVQGENPVVKTAAVKGGAGFGGPPPVSTSASAAPSAPAPAERAPFWHAGRSPAEIATTNSLASTQAQIAASRLLASYAPEQIANALARFDQMGVDRSKLTPTQLAAAVKDGSIPAAAIKDVGPDTLALVEQPGGDFAAVPGMQKPITTAPGATTRFPASFGLQPGRKYSQEELKNIGGAPGMPPMPGSQPGTAEATPGGGFSVSVPPLRQAETRDAIDAYTAQRKAEDPTYVFTDKDLNAAVTAHKMAIAPIAERAENGFVQSVEAELGRKLNPKELAAAHVKYQSMLAEGKETADTKAMRAVAAELARARADEIKERNTPEAMESMVKAWQLGIPPRDGKEADRAVRYAAAHDMELPVPLSGPAQTALRETMPVLEMIQRVKTALEPFKNDTTPGQNFLDRAMYAAGVGNDKSKLLSQLELGRITQSARLMKSSSRSIQVLDKAMIHNPNNWVDSGKLMYDKLDTIEQALQDTVHATKMFGLKSGIVPATVGKGLPLPDGGGQLIDKKTAAMFYDAAGQDPAKAMELAEKHNWKTK